MKRSDFFRTWLLCLVLGSTPVVHGQGTKNLPFFNSKTAADTAKIIEKARADRAAEAARSAQIAEPLKRMDAVVDQARNSGPPQPSFAEQAKDAESRKRLEDAMSRVSPEGRAILAQNAAVPNLRAPDDSGISAGSGPSSAGTKSSPLSSNGPGPKPQPLKATPLATTEKPARYTVINAGSAFFDSKAGFGVFVDDVVLDHPEFHLTSDELEVYMNKDESKEGNSADGAGAGQAPGGPTAGQLAEQGAANSVPNKGEPAPSERKANGNIKQAIAKGRKVLVTKLSPEGEPQTGIGREAVYDGATGDMILRGWPQIQKGTSLQVATEPTTYFIIKANGQFYAQGGRSQTRIVQDEQKKEPPPPSGASPSPAPVPPPPGTGPGINLQGR